MRLIVFLIDAFCSQYLSPNVTPYLRGLELRKLKTLLGYSFGILTSIWTGTYPRTHDLWTEFYYDPKEPSKLLQPLRYIPHGKLQLLLKRILFEACARQFKNAIPGIPVEVEHYFRRHNVKYTDMLPSSVKVPSIIDFLVENRISYFFASFRKKIPSRYELSRMLSKNAKVHLFYIAKLDSLGHEFGPNSSGFLTDIQRIDEMVESSVKLIEQSYEDIELIVLSDHGMAPVTGYIDLRAKMPSELRLGIDYLVFLDETLARFWFFNEKAREEVVEILRKSQFGHLILNEDFRKYGLDFQDSKYGEVFFVMKQSNVIFPSFFGRLLKNSLKGMHGYLPSEPLSSGVLLYKGRYEIEARSISVVDILPSILRILGIRSPSWIEGRNFFI